MPAGARLLKFWVCVAGALLISITLLKDAVERPLLATLPEDARSRPDPRHASVRHAEDVQIRSVPIPTSNSTRARSNDEISVHSTPATGKGYLISSARTEISDIFISLKTSGKFHKSRLGLLLDTWIPMAKDSVSIFTDVDDPELAYEAAGVKLINTRCPTGHNRQHLSCKLGVELHTYLLSNKRWFCHVDDDNYLNVHNLVSLLWNYSHEEQWYLGKSSLGHALQIMDPIEKDHNVALWFATGGAGFCLSQGLARRIKPYVENQRFSYWSDMIHLPDDCTLGYIVCHLVQQKLTEVPGLHSHLEGLWPLNDDNIGQQITFSYGYFEDKERRRTPNVVSVEGGSNFNISDDPTRLRTSHCLMFPQTHQCYKYRVPGGLQAGT